MPSKLSDAYHSPLGQAALGAAVLWAALPPWDLGPLGWIAPLWWVMLVRRKDLSEQPPPGRSPLKPHNRLLRRLIALPRWLLDRRHPYRALWLAGFLFWLAALHWLRLPYWATGLLGVALSFYLAFYLPVFIGLSRVAVHQIRVPVILAAPVVWTGLELARGHLLTGFTMASLGHTQYRWIELIQLSDLAGAYGVSFVVMFVAACLARMIPCRGRPRALWPLVPGILVAAAAVLYGYVRTSGPNAQPVLNVALIQESIDAEIKSDPNRQKRIFPKYFRLSQEALGKYPHADLLVWPETMFSSALFTYDEAAEMPEDFEGTEAEFRQKLKSLARQSRDLMRRTAQKLGVPLILGVGREHFSIAGLRYFNSAVCVASSGELVDCYDKMHLVVFGEYVPFARYFPWVHRLTPMQLVVSPGKRPVAFPVGGLRLAPNICYETVIPHLIRRQVNTLKAQGVEPDVLVNLTNDGWFRGSSELDMHLICGVFRAVECRKPLLIAANTGFSAFIDGDGRIRKQGSRRARDVILAEVGPDGRSSWYLEHGDWPAGVCLAACVVFAMAGGWDRIRRKSAFGKE